MTASQGPPPPWTWSRMTDQEATDLDENLGIWVVDYNTHLAVTMPHIIPACWRQHPALVQELAVQYWAWHAVHRDPAAKPLPALDYYDRHLPSFRLRLDGLLAPDPLACRSGHHPDPDTALRQTILRAANDVAARGPGNLDVLVNSTFGH